MKGACGHETDRLYEVEEHTWVCADCALKKMNYVTEVWLESWTDEQLEREGVTR